jgi:hypothetical protein
MTRQYLARGELEHNLMLYLFVDHSLYVDPSRDPPLRLGGKIDRAVAIRIPQPEAVMKMEYAKRTRVFGQAVRDVARASKALGVLLMMDAWHASSDKAPDDHHYGWIEENQDGEALFMRLEHRAFARPYAWASPIHRNPLQLDPWKGGEQSGSSEKSRLANFIEWRS